MCKVIAVQSDTFWRVWAIAALLMSAGCGGGERKPVDIFPEDICAFCKMAVSDQRVASEIISESGEVWKFDDIGCCENYRAEYPGLRVAAQYVKDYETKGWLRWEDAVIVTTGLFTPMGSGRIAVRDSGRAREFARDHPVGQE